MSMCCLFGSGCAGLGDRRSTVRSIVLVSSCLVTALLCETCASPRPPIRSTSALAPQHQIEFLGTAECYVVVRPKTNGIDVQWELDSGNVKLTIMNTRSSSALIKCQKNDGQFFTEQLSTYPGTTYTLTLSNFAATPKVMLTKNVGGTMSTVWADTAVKSSGTYAASAAEPLFHILRFGSGGSSHKHDVLVDYQGLRTQFTLE